MLFCVHATGFGIDERPDMPAVEPVQLEQLTCVVAVTCVCQPAQQCPVQHHLQHTAKAYGTCTTFGGLCFPPIRTSCMVLSGGWICALEQQQQHACRWAVCCCAC